MTAIVCVSRSWGIGRDGALLFLLNNKAASFITGVVIPIDGGFSAYSGV